jgi:hypothetical protein
VKRLAIALLLFAAAAATHAQTTTPSDALPLSIWSEPEKHEVRMVPGFVTLHINDFTFHIPYIPLVEPLPGSVPGRTSVIPTAFELLHMQFPYRTPPVDEVQKLAEKLAAEARQ